ncbi:SDR family oxidoreductase [Eubacterium sp.]|uniref:SDR family NAD(P)-dependent oxidoreductase n=1 Tax=Eubacterium sp. TaxID=142586 RepID=UPI0026E00525|nr:SDR family NAD(P)-dependent oxidoreductase [Eubacterium sp.]MDO5434018.1 SDR family NAD(P)-dependent oxidoreductase [Eubacterium sp.]
MMKIAIITGASSGLGREFVKQVSAQGQVEEIWAIARRKERLDALNMETATPVRALALDLRNIKDLDALTERLEKEQPDVRLFIGAAGIGKLGTYAEVTEADTNALIDLNCRGAVDVTLRVLPYMNKGARLMQICSVAAFMPLPGMNLYAASKAFLLSYTRALRWELFGRGIRVTAVCPYWIKDTEFVPTASRNGDRSAVRHFPLASTVQTVARRSLLDSRMGVAVSTPGLISLSLRVFDAVVPHFIGMGIWDKARKL